MANNREIVLEALLLYDKGEYADKIIKSVLDKYSYLERFERSFINRVFTGTIERKLYLDYIINSFSSVKVNKQKPVIRAIVRMTTYQLIFMDSVPDSAAINEAVKLAKKKKFNGLTGFVNGLLRKIAKDADKVKFPTKEDDIVKYLSVMYSSPEWLCKHFVEETDADTAEKILANSIMERPLVIRTNVSKISPVKLKKRLTDEGVKVTDISESESAFIIENTDGMTSLDCFNEGLFCVQDLSSQALFSASLSESLAAVKYDIGTKSGVAASTNEGFMISEILKSAELAVDVCAAPGGKTCHLADLLASLDNKKCRIISRDLTDAKADKIDENIERCNFDNVETQVHDAILLDESLLGKADLVIADLPCSGLGVIGRKADIKYRVSEEDLISLAGLQRDILKIVSQYVKKGGMLIFSTCTVNKRENIENAEWIVKELGFRPLSKACQLLNTDPENDGFFISRFIKD